jgi:hypothetical protein
VLVFTTSIFYAQGATKLNFNLSLVFGVCNIIVFYFGSHYSIEIVASLLLIVYLLFQGPKLYYGCRLINLKVSTVMENLAKVFFINLISMILSFLFLKLFESKLSNLLLLVTGCLFYLIIFLSTNFLFNKNKLMEFSSYLLKVLKEK